jgi:hypothetical protein
LNGFVLRRSNEQVFGRTCLYAPAFILSIFYLLDGFVLFFDRYLATAFGYCWVGIGLHFQIRGSMIMPERTGISIDVQNTWELSDLPNPLDDACHCAKL